MNDQNAVTTRELEQRIARLERLLLSAYALIVAAVLIAGLVVPFFTNRERSGNSRVDTPVSVLVVISKAGVAPSKDSGDDAALSALFMTGFIGLLVVTVLLLVMLILAARGTVTAPMRRVGWVLVTLGVIGAFVLLGFTVKAAGSHGSAAPGWGGVVLMLGVIGVMPVLTRAAGAPASARS